MSNIDNNIKFNKKRLYPLKKNTKKNGTTAHSEMKSSSNTFDHQLKSTNTGSDNSKSLISSE